MGGEFVVAYHFWHTYVEYGKSGADLLPSSDVSGRSRWSWRMTQNSCLNEQANVVQASILAPKGYDICVWRSLESKGSSILGGERVMLGFVYSP